MNSKIQIIRRFSILLIISVLTISFVAQVDYDSWRNNEAPKLNTQYNIYIEPQPFSGETAKIASLGETQTLANWYWLSLIQYYGGGDPYGKYRKLAEMFNAVTDLSPKFLEAYQMGLLILPGEGSTDQAIALGKKGEKNLPNAWEIPYYTGLAYHMYKKDYTSAAQEFDKAAAIPGAPDNTKFFAALYYKNADQRVLAYQIFKTVYDTTTNQYFKDRAQKYVEHLSIIFFLEDAGKVYKERYGQFPKTLDDLVAKKVIKEIPKSPLDRNFIIDPSTGTVSEAAK